VILPECFAILLVDGHNRRAAPAGIENDAIVDDERRLAVAPIGRVAAEVLHDVDGPPLLAGCRVEARQFAAASECVHAIAFYRWCAARAIAHLVPKPLPVGHFPQALAGCSVKRDHVLHVAARAKREQPSVRCGER